MNSDNNSVDTKMLEELESASQEAARLGGEVLKKWLGKTTTTEKNGPQDLVTQADFESQTVIQNFLSKEFPSHQFIGEEDQGDHASDPAASEFCWIVDPLDGTTNFVHQLRSFSVSVGLQHREQLVAGSVFDPMLDECYSAHFGGGARLNGNAISNSGEETLANSLFVFSFSRGVDRNSPDTKRFLNMLEHVGSIRRLGSAALNLSYVASGRSDGYWATSLSKWDVAAGWLIATEAGAILEDFAGQPLDLNKPHFCCAATRSLFDQIKPLLLVD